MIASWQEVLKSELKKLDEDQYDITDFHGQIEEIYDKLLRKNYYDVEDVHNELLEHKLFQIIKLKICNKVGFAERFKECFDDSKHCERLKLMSLILAVSECLP